MSAKFKPSIQNAPSGERCPKTAKKLSVHSLDDFKQLWKLAFDASSDMITILDKGHRIVSVNAAMADVLGCTPEEAKGRHCYDIVHGSAAPPIECPHKALMEDGKEHRTELYEERLDAWLSVSVTPLYNDHQELVGSIHIARDITLQKRTAQAHRESEERYRHLSEATVEGVLLSKNAKIIAANHVLADILGYTIDELIGMNILKFIAPLYRDTVVQLLRNRLTGIHALECCRKNGELFPIEAHIRAVNYKGGMVYQAAIRDLTEQRRLEHERAQRERLQGVMEMAGAVCHEINQPLMALQGFMDILASKTEQTQNSAQKLKKMAEQIERIKKLTHKFMHITRYQTKDYAGGEKIIDIEQAAHEKLYGGDGS